MTRLKLQVQVCDFRDECESNERVLEQFIAGIRQNDLLSTDKNFTAEQALETRRTYEASIYHMKQLAEAQGSNAVRTFPERKGRNFGGSNAGNTCKQWPAYGTMSTTAESPVIGAKCVDSRNSKDQSQTAVRAVKTVKISTSITKQTWQLWASETAMHSIGEQSRECADEQFQHMSFAEIKISSVCTRDEVSGTLNIKLESKPGNHTLKLIVDTGAQNDTPSLQLSSNASKRSNSGFPKTWRECETESSSLAL